MTLLITIILGIIWSEIISHFGASILLHRHYCHKQFDVPVWFENVGLFMLMVAVIRSPIGWIASHRMHHAYSGTEKDPHAPAHVGFWKVLSTTWSVPKIPLKYARDLYKNPRLVFCHKHWFKIAAVIWIVTFLISPYLFLGFVLIPFIVAKIGFGLINTACHVDPTEVRNVPILNLIVAGEGYHKNHHDNYRRIRLGKYDIGGYLAEKFFVKK